MTLNRRRFFTTAWAAACAGALTGNPSLEAAVFTKTLSAPLLTDPAEAAVLAFLRQYSPEVRLIGAGVLARVHQSSPRSLDFLVAVPELSRLVAALSEPLPFAIDVPGLLTNGNTISFAIAGIDFVVENLTPAEFTSRLNGLLRVGSIAFAHDALSWHPGSRTVSDPFSATTRNVLALVNPTVSGATAVDVALRGAAEARALGLTLGPDFTQWQRRTLRLLAAAKRAPLLTAAFLRRLVTTRNTLPPETVAALLLSRTVSSALGQALGVDVPAAVARFNQLRPTLDGAVSNTALWLALLLGPALAPDATASPLLTWAQTGTPLQNSRAQAALAAARAAYALPVLQAS